MLLLCVIKDFDIIQVDYTICKVQFPQGILHETLEHHGCIAQPKWHVGKPIEPKVTHHEGHVLLHYRVHLTATVR